MTGDAARELGAYVTASEARLLADRLEAGQPLVRALQGIDPTRRARIRTLLDAATPAADGDRVIVMAVLRAVQGAHARTGAVRTVWTAPGNLARTGQLTASIHQYVDRARESVICSTFNFQRSSALWAALISAAARPEADVRIYMDTNAADANPRPWQPTTTDVARAMPGATVLRTKEWSGQVVRNHAKFVAVDHQFLIVTSANFSRSAEGYNVELGLVIHDPMVTQAVELQSASLEDSLFERVHPP